MNKIETIAALRNHYVRFGGFTGGWNVLLEEFKEARAFGPLTAVSRPLQSGSLTGRFPSGLVREVEIGNGLSVFVIEDWNKLLNCVQQDALRNRLLVEVTGNLFGDNHQRAMVIAGARDGKVRRSLVNVPVGAPYWNPIEDHLENGLAEARPVSHIFV